MPLILLSLRSARAVVLVSVVLVSGCSGSSDKALMADARAALEKRDHAAAIVLLKTLIQRNPETVAARVLMGKALLDSGDAAGAVVELEKARAGGYPADEVMPPLAEALLNSGQANKLLDQFAATALSEPQAAAKLKVSLAGAQVVAGNNDAARVLVDDALRLDPGNAGGRRMKARLVAGKGDHDQALAIVDGLIADEPNDATAWGLRGELLWLGKSNAPAAESALRRAIEIEPRYSAAHTTLLGLLLQRGDIEVFKKEVQALKKALPEHPDAVFFDAQLALHQQETRRARELVQKLLGFAPDNAYTLQLAGAVELQSGALVAAETFLSKALTRDPALPLARRLLGETYLRGAQPAKALVTLQPLLAGKRPDSQALALAASAQLQAGRFDKAEELYAAAAQADPGDDKSRTALALAMVARGQANAGFAQLESLAAGDAGTYFDLALVSARMRRGELDAALRAADQLLAKKSDKPMSHHVRGQVLMAKQEMQAARTSFQKALDIDPMFLPSVGALAAIDVLERKLPEALKRYQSLVAKDPKNTLALLASAALREQMGATPEEVSRMVDEAISANPEELDPHLVKIDRLLARRQANAALAAAQAAGTRFRDDSRALDALGRAQMAAGDQKQAIATFHKVALLEGSSEQPLIRLAEAYLAAGNRVAARQNLEKALEMRPGLIDVQRRLIQLALLDKRVDEAIKIARSVQRQQPNQSTGVLMEAEIHVSQRAWDAAIAVLKAALARGPDTDVALRLMETYQLARRQADAQTFAERWQQVQPRDAEFVFHLATLALQRKDLAGAETLYRQVLNLKPGHAASANNVAWLMVNQGKPGAVSLAAKAHELAPGEPSYLDTLASAYAAEGRWNEAISAQQKAVTLAPKEANYRLGLAKLQIGAGDKPAAKTVLLQIQALGAAFSGQAEVSQLLQTL